MELKEEAKKLVEKFGGYKTKTGFIIVNIERAKQCALICVDEMLEQNGELYLSGIAIDYYKKKNAELFDVKQGIEKL